MDVGWGGVVGVMLWVAALQVLGGVVLVWR